MEVKVIVDNIAGAAGIAASILTPMFRPERTSWGATNDEFVRRLPGDEFIRHPKWDYTHAVTVNTTASHIWPWLVQIGQGRGGLYSYELLENLVGCDIHNVDHLVPEFQTLKVGDPIKIHPKAPPLLVERIEPQHLLLLRGGEEPAESTAHPQEFVVSTWLFFLENAGAETTRLISRGRYAYTPKFINRLSFGPLLIEPISFVMERKMLLNIKYLAERNHVLS